MKGSIDTNLILEKALYKALRELGILDKNIDSLGIKSSEFYGRMSFKDKYVAINFIKIARSLSVLFNDDIDQIRQWFHSENQSFKGYSPSDYCLKGRLKVREMSEYLEELWVSIE